MKKLLYVFVSALTIGGIQAQETVAAASESRYRFGLRVTPQPTWFASGDKNNVPAGAILGFGFGLNLEYRLTANAALLTGIGGDFEGGKYAVKYEPGVYEVRYWLDEAGDFVKPAAVQPAGVVGYHLKERKVNTTFASVPLILKLSTGEYNGLKYFGMFGGEVGFRLKASATDTYYSYTTYSGANPAGITTVGEHSETDININEEAGTIPLRLGMNVGAGTEYRLGGTTSLLFSVNFFRNFTNFMEKDSEFTIYKAEAGGYKFVRQDLKLTGIRFNIGIMF